MVGEPGPLPGPDPIQRDFLHASERPPPAAAAGGAAPFRHPRRAGTVSRCASGFAFHQRATAVRQRDQAIYNPVVAEALQVSARDTSLAAQLNLAAYRMQPTQDLASRLLNTENTPLSSPVSSRTRHRAG